MGSLLGQKKESSELGMVAPQRVRSSIDRGRTNRIKRPSRNRTIRDRKEPVRRPVPIKRPTPNNKPTPSRDNGNNKDDNNSGSKIPDLPGHGMPDKKEPQQVQITSDPKTDSSDSDKDEDGSKNSSNSKNGQKNEPPSSDTPAQTKQANIMQQLKSVDKKVWYGLGGGLALITLISIAR